MRSWLHPYPAGHSLHAVPTTISFGSHASIATQSSADALPALLLWLAGHGTHSPAGEE